jgi:flagellar biosynthesis component FlhA
MGSSIGKRICHYRQLMKMTQEEFASRVGVTPQAVSKWERDNGLPDIMMLSGIASVLNVSTDTLLGLEDTIVENGDILATTDIKANLTSEPLSLEFGTNVIPIVVEGLKTDYVNEKRRDLARNTGILMPILRFRDRTDLDENAYQVLVYDKVVAQGNCVDDGFNDMIDKAVLTCKDNYSDILNKHLVKIMVDNIKEQFPGVADGFVPEIVSYLKVERALQEKLRKGESIRDMIHILEELEEQ